MGAPYFQIKEILKKNGVHVFSSNYTLYGDMSARVMTNLARFTPEVEVYSIDEAFLKFQNHKYANLDDIGLEMHRIIKKGVGIPISVGFAPTKALAKVANKIAKSVLD